MKPILLIKTGTNNPDAIEELGDFEHWFYKHMTTATIIKIDVYRGERLPGPDGVCGIVITGSDAMVSDRAPWSEYTAQWLSSAIEAEIPVLGVCIGHQLIAHALGGLVGKNPKGWQIGTVSVHSGEEASNDSLIRTLPASYLAQTDHKEVILSLPEGAIRLSSNEMDENFVVRFAPNVWGVQ